MDELIAVRPRGQEDEDDGEDGAGGEDGADKDARVRTPALA